MRAHLSEKTGAEGAQLRNGASEGQPRGAGAGVVRPAGGGTAGAADPALAGAEDVGELQGQRGGPHGADGPGATAGEGPGHTGHGTAAARAAVRREGRQRAQRGQRRAGAGFAVQHGRHWRERSTWEH